MDTQNLADAASPMSMWDMVWSSDTVTKVVMIGLIRGFGLVVGDYHRKSESFA